MRVYYPVARAILTVEFDAYGDDREDGLEGRDYVIPIIAKAATVHRNSYRQADSWELTFDAADLPIDPQQVRAGAAEIYLFELKPGMRPDQVVASRQFATAEEAAAARGPNPLGQLGAGAEGSKDRFTLGNNPTIVGLFDEQDLELSADGKWVTISGQDYTALLASRQWPPTSKGLAQKIPVGRRLDRQLRAILAKADPKGRLRLVVENLNEFDLPVVGKSEAASNGRGIPVDESTSYWDVMYKLATRHGCILFVRGLDVVLSRPKNLTSLATADIKRLAWGDNVEKVSLKRHLGKERVPRIILKAYDHRGRGVMIVEYPPLSRKGQGKILKGKPRDRVSVRETGGSARSKTFKTPHAGAEKKGPITRITDEYQIIPVWGITDRQVLLQAAENRYHLLGRSERQLIAVTRDLADLDGRSLLDLNAGDAVEVEWALDRELLTNATEDARYGHLIAAGYNPTVAAAIAQNYTQLIGQKRPMRVHEVSYEYSVDDGLSIELQLHDFIVVDGLRDPNQRLEASKKRRERVRGPAGKPLGSH